MTVRFYVDEHVPTAITEGLRSRGEDVLTVQEDGYAGTADELILDRALMLERILLTQDKDFLKISGDRQNAGLPFAGIVYAPQQGVSPGQCLGDLKLIAGVFEWHELISNIVRIPIR